MKKFLRNILRLLRPRQWVKNFAIFASIIFSGELFDQQVMIKVFLGFLIFCALSSGIYVVNDMFDIQHDRQHPFKRFRPLAHKDISLQVAAVLAFVLILGSILLSYFITPGFFLITIVYFLLHVSYSAFLKQIEIIDILALAYNSTSRFP